MKRNRIYQSWGRVEDVEQEVHVLQSRHDAPPPVMDSRNALPFGLGRSYGDSCLNDGGDLWVTPWMDKILSFDSEQGLLRCEAGMSLATILQWAVPRGWFLSVTPGTKFVTVGGAIANDVHGKNHHRAGTFGHHVTCLELLRSDGQRMLCSREENPEWFAATLGGLGLTGLITWAEFRLKRIDCPLIDSETLRFENLDHFFELAAESDASHEYTMSWIDCVAKGDKLGRGLFMRGNWLSGSGDGRAQRTPPSIPIPFNAPSRLLHPVVVQTFNALYYRKQRADQVRKPVPYDPFFYPLDRLLQWNRLYGSRGFYQYQCVVPFEHSREPIRDILRLIAESGQASFLAVLKLFGNQPSEGLLSFPRPGITLALDFANRGESTLRLFRELDGIVRQADGALYPAKDGRMTSEDFQRWYPQWETFSTFVDPRFSSSFWRRVCPSRSPHTP